MKHFKTTKKGMYLDESFKRQKQMKLARKLKEQRRQERYEDSRSM
jgi:hypothetical protein